MGRHRGSQPCKHCGMLTGGDETRRGKERREGRGRQGDKLVGGERGEWEGRENDDVDKNDDTDDENDGDADEKDDDGNAGSDDGQW